ncbi:MAG: hypothetical protein ACI8QZ_002779 [Chlamydiales bacterium]|jgi:hypothetical protein
MQSEETNTPGQRMLIEFPGQEHPPAELPRRGKLVIGSSTERVDLVLSGAGIEPVHCTIRPLKGGGWALVDMGSATGTRVNGRVAETVRLAHGDVIKLGSTLLHIVDPSAPKPVEPERLASGTAAAPKEDVTGTRISGYRIDSILGRGGMGQVYLALQERLDRKVALKVLPPDLAADSDFVHRFQAEARAAAALNHPNIVTIFDVGDEGDRHFISMEYMHAGCLETRLAREGRLPWKVVLDILHDAASGLVYAESRGIVHRDIKPSNLMQNESGTTKIADLGLAMQTEQAEAQTEGQRIYGTPHFIAPELIHGEKPDCRSDLYSLGATAYRLITGETPFEGQTPREILRNALTESPRPVASLAPDAPVDLQRTIERLLQRSPTERHPSAAILLKEIDRMRATGGVDAAASVKPAHTSGKRLLIGAGVALLIGAGAWLAAPFLTGTDSAEATGDPGSGPSTAGDPLAVEFEGVVFAEDEPDAESEASDDDMASRLLEAEAEVEYLKLGEQMLSDEARERRLMELAERYKGTNSAYRALDEVVSDRAARADAEVRSQEASVAMQAALQSMNEATKDIAPQRVRSAFEALRTIDVPGGLAQAADFNTRREALEQTLLQRAIDHARGVLVRADALAVKGDFDGVERLLTKFSSVVELPASGPDEKASPLADQFEQIAIGIYGRISKLGTAQESWLANQVGIDGSAIAAGLRGPDGLAAQLAKFDFASAVSLLDTILASVRTAESRTLLGTLRQDIQEAGAVLETLGKAWDQNGWRRRSIADPSAPRSAKRDAVGADARGVVISTGGETQHLPWGAWAGHPRELHVLFNERLARPWSEDERAGIATLFRLGAVTDAARWAATAMESAHPGEVPHKDVLTFFDQAQPWAAMAGSAEVLGNERAALELLAASLEAQEAGMPGVALARLERLLDQHGTSLFVLLLSESGPAAARASEDAPVAERGRAPLGTGRDGSQTDRER